MIDKWKGKERQTKTCNTVVISYTISSPTSLYMVTYTHSTFSIHLLSKLLIFIRHMQDF